MVKGFIITNTLVEEKEKEEEPPIGDTTDLLLWGRSFNDIAARVWMPVLEMQ